ncbi:MAG: hypothetical protein MK165_15480 [Pirellulaceae bacterium]|nr:hypothetical protein [Pirellulaceae bacterium]
MKRTLLIVVKGAPIVLAVDGNGSIASPAALIGRCGSCDFANCIQRRMGVTRSAK